MILAEMNDLDRAGLIGVINSDGELVRVTTTAGGLGGFQNNLRGIDLTNLQLTNIGKTLHGLMGLDRVPNEDLEEVSRGLHGLRTKLSL